MSKSRHSCSVGSGNRRHSCSTISQYTSATQEMGTSCFAAISAKARLPNRMSSWISRNRLETLLISFLFDLMESIVPEPGEMATMLGILDRIGGLLRFQANRIDVVLNRTNGCGFFLRIYGMFHFLQSIIDSIQFLGSENKSIRFFAHMVPFKIQWLEYGGGLEEWQL